MPRTLANVLGIVPFIVLLALYFSVSSARRAENPRDKLTPGIPQFAEGWKSVWAPRIAGYEEVQWSEGDSIGAVARRAGVAEFAEEIRPVVRPLGNPPRALSAGENLRVTITPVADPEALPGFDEVGAPRSFLHCVTAGETVESLRQKFAVEGTVEIAAASDWPRAIEVGETVRVPVTERRLVVDTGASLLRLAKGLGLGFFIALAIGVAMGAFTPVEHLLYNLVAGLSKIPPLAVLPIIFIFQGVGEAPKMTIIALGIAPTMTLDIFSRCREFPRELIVKAYTLGASTVEVVFKVMLPAIWPAVLAALRLAIGPAWVYLIAAEAIAAEAGLGYRIFVVQRQLGMNIILIYVAWIMVLGLSMDLGLKYWIAWRHKWSEAA